MDISRKGYRLPTEAEWEYAAANVDRDEELGKYGWYGENSLGVLNKVAQKASNDHGLYDMVGNVAEWCWDYYYKKHYESEEDKGTVKNPTGPSTRQNRVVRGGSYSSAQKHCRSFSRGSAKPTQDSKKIGFRIVLNIPSKK